MGAILLLLSFIYENITKFASRRKYMVSKLKQQYARNFRMRIKNYNFSHALHRSKHLCAAQPLTASLKCIRVRTTSRGYIWSVFLLTSAFHL
jgi:hypothetical protein